MTKEQYERWKDFALRMARTCFKGSRRPLSSWIIEQVEGWFDCRDHQKDWGKYNSWDQDRYPLCDHVAEFFDGCPRVECKACREGDDECECDEIEYLAREQFDDQWYGPVRCCLRAGIDFACSPSAGVVGFTAGDLRRMYPEGVPAWVSGGDEKWCPWLAEHDESKCNKFADLPDDAWVAL